LDHSPMAVDISTAYNSQLDLHKIRPIRIPPRSDLAWHKFSKEVLSKIQTRPPLQLSLAAIDQEIEWITRTIRSTATEAFGILPEPTRRKGGECRRIRKLLALRQSLSSFRTQPDQSQPDHSVQRAIRVLT